MDVKKFDTATLQRIVARWLFSKAKSTYKASQEHKPAIEYDPRITVKVVKLHKDAIIPSYVHEGDSGFDLHALEDTQLNPYETKLVRTGLMFEIPEGYEIQVRPRSGVSLNTPILIRNSPGTIDSSYRGELHIMVHNLGKGVLTIVKNNKVAQGILAQVPRAKFVESDGLTETSRGADGFGSTGM